MQRNSLVQGRTKAMSEDIPPPSLPEHCLLLSAYAAMMLAAGLLGIFLGLVPRARQAKLSPRAERFYEFCTWVAEFKVALLVHLRCARRRVAAVRCPRCAGGISMEFDPSGRRLSLACPGYHVWSNLPILVSPPSWWRSCIKRPWWQDDWFAPDASAGSIREAKVP
jgi:hypothetical protein